MDVSVDVARVFSPAMGRRVAALVDALPYRDGGAKHEP
jgi:hypothetical protein